MTASTALGPRLPGAAIVTAAAWLGLAVLAGVTGFLVQLPFPGPQLIILALVVAALAAGTMLPALRAWIDALPLGLLVGVNGLRFVGIAFLVLASRGELARAFADRAGWGDIAAATVALGLVALGNLGTPSRRLLVHAWNAFGALDLVVAVGTATWVTLNHVTPGVEPVLSWPLSVVPLFFVPILFANHVFIFRRLRAASEVTDGR